MFKLSEEQSLISESAKRYTEEQFDFRKRQEINQSENGFDKTQWQKFAELGWLGIGFPEACGGFGGSLVDTALLVQQQAKALLMTPFATTVGMSGSVLQLAGNEEQQSYIESIIAGDAIICCAFSEAEQPDPLQVDTHAVKTDTGYVINGCKRLVTWGAQSDYVIINAKLGDAQADPKYGLFIVPTKSKGLNLLPYKMYDGSRSSDMEFSDVEIPVANKLDKGDPQIVQQVCDNATALLCAEASAIMWAIHDQTLEYMKTREQFGQTLGSMQALQHRIVDVYVLCQLCQSMAEDAVMAMTEDYCESTAQRVAAAKAFIGMHGRKVGKEGIQLHGGIGMTDDLAIGHFFKRLSAIERLLGNTTWHLQRCQKLSKF